MSVATRRDVWMLARELAEAIAETPELQEYRRTEDAVLADPEAVALIQEYEAAKSGEAFRGRPRRSSRPWSNGSWPSRSGSTPTRPFRPTGTPGWRCDAFMDRLNAVITFPITGQEAPKTKGGACGSGGGCGCGG